MIFASSSQTVGDKRLTGFRLTWSNALPRMSHSICRTIEPLPQLLLSIKFTQDERSHHKMPARMKKTEMKPYKMQLLEMRAQLRGDVSAMANSALSKDQGTGGGSASNIPSHIADMGSDTYEQDNTLLLMNNEGETLSQIEAALERMEDRTYGICNECCKPIPKRRLEAIPYTPYCVKCASEIQSRTE